MNIFNKQMLQSSPGNEYIIDDIENRNFQISNGDHFTVGCASIAITNLMMFYEKQFLRCPTIEAMIKEAHFALEETSDGGVKGNNIINFLFNEGLTPQIISYPNEIDLLEAVADPLKIGLLIIHVGEATHIQTIRQSPLGRFQLGSLELNLDQLMNLVGEKQGYTNQDNKNHYHPSVLIKISTRKRT